MSVVPVVPLTQNPEQNQQEDVVDQEEGDVVVEEGVVKRDIVKLRAK